MVDEKILNIGGIDYIISSDGHVYSTKNVGNGKYHKEITQRVDKDGYMIVSIGGKGNRTTKFVHRLVAQAFLDNPCGLLEVDHKNDIRNDNRVENLQWVSKKYNIDKIPQHKKGGRKNGKVKLNWEIAESIRKEYKELNLSMHELSEKYNVSYSTILRIVKNKIWNVNLSSVTTIENVV